MTTHRGRSERTWRDDERRHEGNCGSMEAGSGAPEGDVGRDCDASSPSVDVEADAAGAFSDHRQRTRHAEGRSFDVEA
jgi:hypothetical protein